MINIREDLTADQVHDIMSEAWGDDQLIIYPTPAFDRAKELTQDDVHEIMGEQYGYDAPMAAPEPHTER